MSGPQAAAGEAAAGEAAAPAGLVLRRALIGWGLGDLALGQRRAAAAWLTAELLAAALVAWLVIGLAETTAYLVPFLAGCAFLGVWVLQAALAYRRARAARGETGPAPVGSPAAAIAWLALPLLVWGTAFWLVGGQAGTPGAVLDRFETAWPDVEAHQLPASLASDPADVTQEARSALATLHADCAARGGSDCSGALGLLRDLRISVTDRGDGTATALAQVVTFERRPTTILGFISGTELVPVPQRTVLTLELATVAAPLPGGVDVGAHRWQIVNASPSP